MRWTIDGILNSAVGFLMKYPSLPDAGLCGVGSSASGSLSGSKSGLCEEMDHLTTSSGSYLSA